ncbi:hypothetical protein IFM89_016270 [Coptis chinensis]|uniref:Tubby C-terminal domain-containing protein n=1 Tax=Coptis chinensis TaxID=261450 RepID=A0A835H6F3_9MAGN|nr:hypothetical protein IFM89_016270 [Coptis chinensis]
MSIKFLAAPALSGLERVEEVLLGHGLGLPRKLSYGKTVFLRLCDILQTKGLLTHSRSDASQPPYEGAKPSSSRASRRFASKQISPQVPAGNFEIGQISYKFNLLKSRGPRRMLCMLQCPSTRPKSDDELKNDDESKKPTSLQNSTSSTGSMVLKNKLK